MIWVEQEKMFPHSNCLSSINILNNIMMTQCEREIEAFERSVNRDEEWKCFGLIWCDWYTKGTWTTLVVAVSWHKFSRIISTLCFRRLGEKHDRETDFVLKNNSIKFSEMRDFWICPEPRGIRFWGMGISRKQRAMCNECEPWWLLNALLCGAV